MTDMTLEQVRDELRSRGMEGTMQPSYEFCDELADAIDAHLAKAAQGEAVAYRYRQADEPGKWMVFQSRTRSEALKESGLIVEPLYATPTIPTGHKVVPVEPTDDMCRNAREKIGIGSNVAHHVWHWMISAAPDGEVG